jgi:RHS repeat-associated protein
VYIYTYNTSGWAAFDNVRLSKPTGATIKRSSYGIAGQMIATRVSGDPVSGNNGLFYVYSDHLGSSSVLVNGRNNPVAGGRAWYLPFGGYRPGSTPTQTITDRDFTGQRENMELGLLYYNARFYAPTLGRFISADTLVPDPADPQSYNRYSYGRNRALKFVDPTGHRECDIATLDCDGGAITPEPSTAPGSREMEMWELHALMQAVYSETQNGSYPTEHLEFLAWAYLNRISSGKWSNMGDAVYSDPPTGYVKGTPIFPCCPQSSAGVLWDDVRSTWTRDDVPELVEERWAYNANPNWDVVENTVNSVYADWLENGAGSANDPTHGGYFYASLTRNDENYGGVSASEFDALVVDKIESFQSYQNANHDFRWGHTEVYHSSGQYKVFFAANAHCGYQLNCGE